MSYIGMKAFTIYNYLSFIPLRKLEDYTNPFWHQGLWRLTWITIIPIFLDVNGPRCWFAYSCKKLNEWKSGHGGEEMIIIQMDK